MPARQPKRSRLWLTDGSCIRLRLEHPSHVWSYDFVEDRTHQGPKFRMLNVIDEFTREYLAIRVDRRLRSADVIDVPPTCSSSGTCLDTSAPTRPGVHRPGTTGLYRCGRSPHGIHRTGQPWENCFCESFNARLPDELLDGEIFNSLEEARVIIEARRRHYNAVRPHSSLGYRVTGRVDAAVYAKAALPWPLPPVLAAAVKRADDRLCATEQCDLVCNPAFTFTNGCKPNAMPAIRPDLPGPAEAQFLHALEAAGLDPRA